MSLKTTHEATAAFEPENGQWGKLFGQAPLPMAMLSGPRHIFTFANASYRNSFCQGRDIVGRSVSEVLPEIVEQGFIGLLDQVFQTKEPYFGTETPIAICPANGQVKKFFLNFVFQPVLDDHGEMDGIFVVASDVSAQVAARENIQRQQDWLEAIMDRLPTPVFLVDPVHQIVTFTNAAAVQLIGMPIEGTRPGERYDGRVKVWNKDGVLVDMIDLPSVRASRGEEMKGEEMTIETPSGRYNISAASEMIPASFGHDPTALLVLQDVTAIKAAEEQFRLFTELAPQMPFIANSSGAITYFSKQWSDYTGISEGLEGWGWKNQPIHHPDDLARMISTWMDSVRTGAPYQIEYRLRRHDGEYRWHLGRATAVKDPQGQTLKWFGTNVDIHDQKVLAEQFKNAIEVANLGFWDYCIERGSVRWNENLRRHYGFPIGKLTGSIQEVFERIHPEDRTRVSEALSDFDSKKTRYHLEFRVVPSPGQIRWLACEGDVFYAKDGQALRMNGTSLDVTDRKLIEGALQAAKHQAEIANETKSAFLANMSHEIRTPLGAILGFTELLRGEKLSAEARGFVDVIERNGQALTRLIDDILDLSKVEAGQMTIELVPFKLEDVVSEIVTLFSEKVRSKGITFEFDRLPSMDRVISDPARLRQILVNLVGNAVKFTEKGGVKISVEIRAGESGKARVIFRVTDTGTGLSMEQAGKLFRPFVQADNSTSRQFGGTGLGLVLSQRLARAMGGDVWIENCDLGRGCTFVFDFEAEVTAMRPLDGNKDQQIASKFPGKRLDGVTVLVVDDSSDNRTLVKLILNREGAKIDEATSGGDAVEKAMSKNHDVILMDIQMPMMDGYSALQALQKRGYSKPVLALTAHAMSEERQRTKAAGFNGHLTKPLDRESLVAEILKNLN